MNTMSTNGTEKDQSILCGIGMRQDSFTLEMLADMEQLLKELVSRTGLYLSPTTGISNSIPTPAIQAKDGGLRTSMESVNRHLNTMKDVLHDIGYIVQQI